MFSVVELVTILTREKMPYSINALFEELEPYAEWADQNYLEDHKKRYIETLKLVPRLPPGSKLIDIGIGCGHLSFLISRIFGYSITGVDVEDTLIPPAKESVEFIGCDLSIEKLPFGNDSFDCALLTEVIEHFSDPKKIIKEARRVIRPGGYLLITTTNKRRFSNWLSIWKGRAPTLLHTSHVYEFEITELRKIIAELGFRVCKTHFCEYKDTNMPSFYPNRCFLGWGLRSLFSYLFVHMRSCILILARKDQKVKKAQ